MRDVSSPPAARSDLDEDSGLRPGAARRETAQRFSAVVSEIASRTLDFPMPGSGHTSQRLAALRSVAQRDLYLARLVEGHTDATAILAELAGPAPGPAERWGVWAAEPPGEGVTATRTEAGWRTAKAASEAGARVLHPGAQNPGKARAAATQHALAALETSTTATWIASTDADSVVPPNWLAFQLDQARAGWEAVIGTVTVTRWPPIPQLADRHHQLYNASRPTSGVLWRHPHVHGANLGVAATAYQEVGGFAHLPVGEDHALVSALERNGHRVLRTPECPVETSSRLRPGRRRLRRAPGPVGS